MAAVSEGEAAVQATLEYRPDAVLLDYRLPGMDGVQTTRAIREAAPDVAVVCLTGSVDPQETQALYEAGAVACVTKDEELDTIVATVVGAVA